MGGAAWVPLWGGGIERAADGEQGRTYLAHVELSDQIHPVSAKLCALDPARGRVIGPLDQELPLLVSLSEALGYYLCRLFAAGSRHATLKCDCRFRSSSSWLPLVDLGSIRGHMTTAACPTHLRQRSTVLLGVQSTRCCRTERQGGDPKLHRWG